MLHGFSRRIASTAILWNTHKYVLRYVRDDVQCANQFVYFGPCTI